MPGICGATGGRRAGAGAGLCATGRVDGVTGRLIGGADCGDRISATGAGCCGFGACCGGVGAGTPPEARCAAKSCSIAVMRLLFDGGDGGVGVVGCG